MTQWEYLDVEIDMYEKPAIDALNEYGAQGWEVVYIDYGTVWVNVIFKRRIVKGQLEIE